MDRRTHPSSEDYSQGIAECAVRPDLNDTSEAAGAPREAGTMQQSDSAGEPAGGLQVRESGGPPFDREQAMARQRIKQLEQRLDEFPEAERAVMLELLEVLAIDLEELRVTTDELIQRNMDLDAAGFAIVAERERYRQLFELAPGGYLVTTPEGCIREVNRAVAAMLKRHPDLIVGKPLPLFLEERERRPFRQLLLRLRLGHEASGYETRILRPDGTSFPAALDVMPDREGERLVSLRWLIQDISERKQAQDAMQRSHDELELRVRQRTADLEMANQKLRDEIARRTGVEDELRVALRERDVLLREVHHRVKNNLQVICNLVDLQANQPEGKQAPEALSDTRDRIHSIALIHEHLYESEDLARIPFARYTDSLITQLRHAHGGREGITVAVEVGDFALSIEDAIPLGLIVTELTSNALIHAFAGRNTGNIRIALQSSDPASRLTIADDGIGMPEDIDLDDPKTLGLRIVTMLTQQLGGTIELDRAGGSTFTITLPASVAGIKAGG